MKKLSSAWNVVSFSEAHSGIQNWSSQFLWICNWKINSNRIWSLSEFEMQFPISVSDLTAHLKQTSILWGQAKDSISMVVELDSSTKKQMPTSFFPFLLSSSCKSRVYYLCVLVRLTCTHLFFVSHSSLTL